MRQCLLPIGNAHVTASGYELPRRSSETVHPLLEIGNQLRFIVVKVYLHENHGIDLVPCHHDPAVHVVDLKPGVASA